MADEPPRLRVCWADELRDCGPENVSWWTVPDVHKIFGDGMARVTDISEAAEQYGNHFYFERDGYENKWPLVFIVDDGTHHYEVEVDLEHVVEFAASDPKRLDKPAGAASA